MTKEDLQNLINLLPDTGEIDLVISSSDNYQVDHALVNRMDLAGFRREAGVYPAELVFVLPDDFEVV